MRLHVKHNGTAPQPFNGTGNGCRIARRYESMARSRTKGLALAAACAAALPGCATAGSADALPRPILRDFMGICGHTIQFRPELYSKICRLARDYHGFDWDVGEQTDYKLDFPFARNRVNWKEVYGSWKRGGFETNVSVMFKSTKPDSWVDLPRDARRYGEKFARFFGPTHGNGLVSAVEVGNEPGNYNDEAYRRLFENVARGLRKGDPAITILPCNMSTDQSDDYKKNLGCIQGLEDLYDALNIHVYAFAEVWPVWRRVHPEDPSITFLREVRDLLAWRDEHAPGKPVWITEFGWDACTKEPPADGEWAKFKDVSDEDQARYLVRAFMIFARMGVDRAYIFFFNDSDEGTLFACSGITRNYEPKPSFHALAYLYRTLGDYRFVRAVKEDFEDAYVYEFQRGDDPRDLVWVAWAPTAKRDKTMRIPRPDGKVVRAERIPLDDGPASPVRASKSGDSLKLKLGGMPVLLWLSPE